MTLKSQNAAHAPHGEKGLKLRLAAMARQVLERDGLDALTLRAAAREAGVSHMAPYRHFKDKGELLAAVAEQGFRELTEFMDRAIAADGDPRASGVAYVSFALDNPALYGLMFGAGLASLETSPGLLAAGSEAFQRCLDASGAGTPGDSETPAAAIALWSVVHGLASLAIDGLVKLPPKGPARDARIAAILQTQG
jgi:AcrR family transcriptional regulator